MVDRRPVLFAHSSGEPALGAVQLQKPRSYAEAVKSPPRFPSAFKDIPIPPRQVRRWEGKPLILFSQAEVQQAYQDMAFSVVLKFTEHRPRVDEMKAFINQNWKLSRTPIVGALDGRHLLVVCSSEVDAVEALLNDSQRIGNLRFRSFCWTPGFSVNAEPTRMVTWAKLTGLDPCLFRLGFLKEICKGFGTFLRVDPRTLNLSNPGVARVCVEVDVRQTLAQGLWVGTDARQQWVEIEYEGDVNYCSRCKKQGHIVEHCRREIAR